METKINTLITINARLVPFGNITILLGNPSSPMVEPTEGSKEQEKPVYYVEPIDTASLVYDVMYEGHNGGYIVPEVTAGQ